MRMQLPAREKLSRPVRVVRAAAGNGEKVALQSRNVLLAGEAAGAERAQL